MVADVAENGMAMHLFSLFTLEDAPKGDPERSPEVLTGQLIFGVLPC